MTRKWYIQFVEENAHYSEPSKLRQPRQQVTCRCQYAQVHFQVLRSLLRWRWKARSLLDLGGVTTCKTASSEVATLKAIYEFKTSTRTYRRPLWGSGFLDPAFIARQYTGDAGFRTSAAHSRPPTARQSKPTQSMPALLNCNYRAVAPPPQASRQGTTVLKSVQSCACIARCVSHLARAGQ